MKWDPLAGIMHWNVSRPWRGVCLTIPHLQVSRERNRWANFTILQKKHCFQYGLQYGILLGDWMAKKLFQEVNNKPSYGQATCILIDSIHWSVDQQMIQTSAVHNCSWNKLQVETEPAEACPYPSSTYHLPVLRSLHGEPCLCWFC